MYVHCQVPTEKYIFLFFFSGNNHKSDPAEGWQQPKLRALHTLQPYTLLAAILSRLSCCRGSMNWCFLLCLHRSPATLWFGILETTPIIRVSNSCSMESRAFAWSHSMHALRDWHTSWSGVKQQMDRGERKTESKPSHAVWTRGCLGRHWTRVATGSLW